MTEHEKILLDEIQDGSIPNFPMLAVKSRLMGIDKFSDNFVVNMIIDASCVETLKDILVDGIRDGMLKDSFKSTLVFMELLRQRMLKNTALVDAVVNALEAVCPGVLISRFLQLVEYRKSNPRETILYANEMAWLDWRVYKMSSRFASINEKYRDTYHKKVTDAFMSLQMMESVMR